MFSLLGFTFCPLEIFVSFNLNKGQQEVGQCPLGIMCVCSTLTGVHMGCLEYIGDDKYIGGLS